MGSGGGVVFEAGEDSPEGAGPGWATTTGGALRFRAGRRFGFLGFGDGAVPMTGVSAAPVGSAASPFPTVADDGRDAAAGDALAAVFLRAGAERGRRFRFVGVAATGGTGS